MRLAVTAYLEAVNDTFLGQLDSGLELGINYISLRLVEGKKIHELDLDEINRMKEILKKHKVKIMEIDAALGNYNCYDNVGFQKAAKMLEKVAEAATILGVLNIVTYLPAYNTRVEDYDQIIKLANNYAAITDKAKKKLLLRRKKEDLGTSFTHIINGINSKHVGIYFDPTVVVLKNESATTNYRVLKNDIMAVMAGDIDDDINPQLIGYGKAEILDLFKRMINDDYKNYLSIDANFNDIVTQINEETTPKDYKGIKRIFLKDGIKRTKKNEKYFLFKKRLYAKKDATITNMDVLANQINVLKKIFK